MNTQELKTKLAIDAGKLTLSQSTLTSKVGDFVTAFYNGQPIIISDAQPEADGAAQDTVRVSGRSSFLNVADLPVSARFNVDAEGEVHALLRYQLRDTSPGPSAWTFSRSFPTLPAVLNYDTPLPATRSALASFDPMANQRPFLDALELFETYFVVATHAGQDPESGVPLEAGINFVSKLRPGGLLGVLEHTLGDGKPLVLYGAIHVPKVTDTTLPLQPLQQPWDAPTAPGIHLQAALDADFKLGGLRFDKPRFRVYSPPSTEWMQRNTSFAPRHGYTGALSIPSAGIQVDLAADLKWNLAAALLYGSCEGITLGKLSQLLDLTGTDSLTAALPQELQKAVDTLGKLELMHVALELGLAGTTPMVNEVSFTIGMPELKWKVWDEHLEVESISCRFSIQDPFRASARASTGTSSAAAASKPSVDVTVHGTLRIEGVPLAISAESREGFTIRAATRKKVGIPLDKLLASHASGAAAPTPLTINHLGVTVSPGRSYSMSAILGAQPKPWVVPVGKEKLTISDVVLNFTYPKGGPLQGSFGGKLAFSDSVQLAVGCDIPGSLSIRGDFPKVNLTHLIDKLCDQKVPLPGGFDLVLESSSMLIQNRGDSFKFQLGTTVKDLGVFAFEVRKVSGGKWGFATGVDLGGSKVSQLPGLSALRVIEDAFKLQKLMLIVSSFADASFQFPDMAQFNRPALNTKKLSMPRQASGVIPGVMVFAEWQLQAGDKQQELLMKLLGVGATQSAALAIGADPAKDSRLYVTQRATIQGYPLVARFGVELTNGKPSLFMDGTLTVKIQGQPQTFDVTMAFAPGGAFLSGTMKGATAIDCGPFKLSNLALEMGINWGGLPSLGVAATLDVKKFQSSVAVFFDSTQPSRSLVAGSISSVTLKDVVDTLLGGAIGKTPMDRVLEGVVLKGTRDFTIPGSLASELDGLVFDKVSAAFASAAKIQLPSTASQLLLVVNQRGSAWHLTDLTTMRHYELKKQGDQIAVSLAPQFYFAPQATSIGTIKFPQGYYLNAAVSFFGFDVSTTINISQNKGISVDARMDKLTLLDEKLFSIAALQGDGGPKLSLSTFNQPDHPEVPCRKPHFYINGALSMLGLKQGIFANVSSHGIDFKLAGELVPGVNFDLDARFGKPGLSASGNVKVGIGTIDLGALGKVKINTALQVGVIVDIATQNARDVSVGPGTWKLGDTVAKNELGTLVFQQDGNLCWYDTTGEDRRCVWHAATAGGPAARLEFQGDGNLVMFDTANNTIWQSNTGGSKATRLAVQGDGNVCLYDGGNRCVWQSNTRLHPANVNIGHGSWKPGDTVAKNEVGTLVFQQDGNLCLYDTTGGSGRCVWQSATANRAAARLDFQEDGHLVIYGAANSVLWKSNTDGSKANRLSVQADGNVCLYTPAGRCVWQSATRIHARDVSVGHGSWKLGDTVAKNALGQLVFQQDGNLVWDDTTGGSRRCVWQSATANRSTAARLELQGNGNLVVYDTANQEMWKSNTAGSKANRLTVQKDGNVCLYDGAGRCRWQTATHIYGGVRGASIELDTDLVFAGQRIDIPRFRIEAQADTFTKLASHVEKKVEEAFKELYKDATKWANDVANGVLEGAQDTERVLRDIYKKTPQEAQRIIKDASNLAESTYKSAEHAVTSGYKTAEKGVGGFLRSLGD